MKTKLATIIIAGLLIVAVTIGHGRASYARGTEMAITGAEKPAKPLTTDGLAIREAAAKVLVGTSAR